jgi:hypothetical protein
MKFKQLEVLYDPFWLISAGHTAAIAQAICRMSKANRRRLPDTRGLDWAKGTIGRIVEDGTDPMREAGEQY